MNTKDNRHIIDVLFVLALFGIFVLSTIFLISIGAKIYSKTMTNMDKNFNSRTAVAYIIEKVHQSDSKDSVHVATFDGTNALCINSNVNDIDYVTYIYEYDHQLKELTTRSDLDLDKKAGQYIIDIASFEIKEEDNILSCSIHMDNDEDYDFIINLHSQGDMK